MRSIVHNGGRAKSLVMPSQEYIRQLTGKATDTNVVAGLLFFIGVHEGWKNILELGTGGGISTRALTEIAEINDGKVLTVDFYAPSASLVPKSDRVSQILCNTTEHDLVVEKLKEVGIETPLDAIFIDADHTKDAVKRDFELYNHLIKPEGMILFHDICVLDPFCEVPLWWMETEFPGFEKLSFSFNNGLGILRKISKE